MLVKEANKLKVVFVKGDVIIKGDQLFSAITLEHERHTLMVTHNNFYEDYRVLSFAWRKYDPSMGELPYRIEINEDSKGKLSGATFQYRPSLIQEDVSTNEEIDQKVSNEEREKVYSDAVSVSRNLSTAILKHHLSTNDQDDSVFGDKLLKEYQAMQDKEVEQELKECQECPETVNNLAETLDSMLNEVTEENKHLNEECSCDECNEEISLEELLKLVDVEDEEIFKALNGIEETINNKEENEMTGTKQVFEAGTIEHAYVELKGDLSNVVNPDGNSGKNLCYDGNLRQYHRTQDEGKGTFNYIEGWNRVCSFEEFNDYKLKQENPTPQEQNTNPVWTTAMAEEGYPLQAGMICLHEGVEVQVDFVGSVNSLITCDSMRAFEASVPTKTLKPVEPKLDPVQVKLEALAESLEENDICCPHCILNYLHEEGLLNLDEI